MSVKQGIKIAIGGKGGVGKTTVCAVWAQLFAESGFNVLAIDADPNTNLALAFGIAPDRSPESLIMMKELIAERTGTDRDKVGAYFRLNPKVSDLPERYCLEVKGLKLLVLGAITQAGAGCACPEGAFLKAMIRHTILERQEVVLVDLAAGVEFLGRASVQFINALILVVEPGGRSIETANRMAKMAGELGIKCIAAIANKINEKSEIELIRSQLKGINLIGTVRSRQAVKLADLQRQPVFESCAELVEELKSAQSNLMNVIMDPDQLKEYKQSTLSR